MNGALNATPVTQTLQETVRLLAKDHNLKIVSQLTGVPYDLVRQWESRRKRKALKQAGVTLSQTPVKAVADAVEAEMSENERATKLSLSRYAKQAAQRSEKAKLKDSPYVKQVAQTAAIVHRWDAKAEQNNTVVNIALLGVDPGTVQVDTGPTLDVEATEVGSG